MIMWFVLSKYSGSTFKHRKRKNLSFAISDESVKVEIKAVSGTDHKNSWQWGVVDLYVHSETLTGPNMLLQVLVRT